MTNRMTVDPVAYPEMDGPSGNSQRQTDPVRARVNGGLQLTNSQILQVSMGRRLNSDSDSNPQPDHSRLYLLADTRGTGPRGPHPGDVLYWVACLGGACLLLLSATT